MRAHYSKRNRFANRVLAAAMPLESALTIRSGDAEKKCAGGFLRRRGLVAGSEDRPIHFSDLFPFAVAGAEEVRHDLGAIVAGMV
jgi:hypothetical protein